MKSPNDDVVVMDAEMSGANGGYDYDINEQVQRVYDWQLEHVAGEKSRIVLPKMSKAHRSVIYKLSSKLGVSYSSEKDVEPSAVTLVASKNYQPKKWPSAYGPKDRKDKKHDKIPKGASEIVDGFLWLGSGRDADDVDELVKLGITHVLNVTEEWKEHPMYKKHGIVFRRIEIKDFVTQSIAAHFEPAFAFVNECQNSGGRILVHCVVGKSRSVSVVMAYLMKQNNWTLKQAYDCVIARRDFARPNDTFLRELQGLEKELHPVVENPTLVHEDLPAMKMPYGGTDAKHRDEACLKFFHDHLTPQMMDDAAGDMDITKRNMQKLANSAVSYAASHFRKEWDQWGKKSVRKAVSDIATRYYESKM